MNRKQLETRWQRHHEKQEWQKQAERAIQGEDEEVIVRRPLPPIRRRIFPKEIQEETTSFHSE